MAKSKGMDVTLSLAQLLAKQKATIEKVLPQHLTAERMMRVAWVLIRRTPKLMECDASTVVEAVVQASTLGLELGREAHLVPYGKICVMIPDYKGIVALARRSGNIKKIEAVVVYEGDHFEITRGDTPHIDHKPDPWAESRTDPSNILGVYAVATFNDGSTQFETMSKDEVDLVKAKSRAKDHGPWSDKQSYPEMCRKTVTKRLCKYLPMSYELASAIEMDNRFESGVRGSTTIFDTEEEEAELAKKASLEKMEAMKEKLRDAEDQGEAEEVPEAEQPKPKEKQQTKPKASIGEEPPLRELAEDPW